LIWEETETENNILTATEYYYDANGNQTGKLFNDLTDQTGAVAGISLELPPGTVNYEYYGYDGFNRLTAYHTPITTAEYIYNTQGLRISKTVNGQETKHIWDGSNMVMELNGSNQVIDKYIRGNRLIKSDLNGYYL
jgi:YD repeat-containing protein